MINYVKGNLLTANVQALVNTVNTVGVMGKGIALQFREKYSTNYRLYKEACKNGTIDIGKLLVVKDSSLEGEKLIINFPTKKEWNKKSQYSFIEEGLKDLVRIIDEYSIKSIALPPLGCGNGGLKWEKVRPLIEKYLGQLDIEILVFEPNDEVKAILQKETTNKNIHLTPGRAMILFALAKYEERGEIANVFAANKLAYFLQESGEPLKLVFVPYTYGPYAQALDKVLYALNGKYISGMEQLTARPLEPLQLKYENFKEVNDFVNHNLTSIQRERLSSVFRLIQGFESTLSLEILASIHFLRSKDKNLNVHQLLQQIKEWNKRKKELISEEYIQIALTHLDNYAESMDI